MTRFLSNAWVKENVEEAVRYFWETRTGQANRSKRDQGNRKAATGGKHLWRFSEIFQEVALGSGYTDDHVFLTPKKKRILPGYFRPTKDWDFLVVKNGRLIAAIEMKSHIGPSFGNNFNNRAEEALGNAVDFWTAYREKVFGLQPSPWLGYVMLLEDHEKARRPTKTETFHFPVLPELDRASYAKRYSELCSRLILERKYSAAALLVAPKHSPGEYSEPSDELSIKRFLKSFRAHLRANISS
ncbi:MAG: PaeR7I family type II restriction endonuclease [Candidatus Lernaella stagnicola]|nr:PaeR7I family type II restriction endonuclease [Candidatus Lernaella stagnicola]